MAKEVAGEKDRVSIVFHHLDAFKGMLRYGMSRDPLEINYQDWELEAQVDVHAMYGHPDIPEDFHDTGLWSVKVVKLFAYYRDSGDFKLEMVWTDAENEEDLRILFPDLAETLDPGMLTYDFEVLSRKMDDLVSLEGHQLRWPLAEGDDLAF